MVWACVEFGDAGISPRIGEAALARSSDAWERTLKVGSP